MSSLPHRSPFRVERPSSRDQHSAYLARDQYSHHASAYYDYHHDHHDLMNNNTHNYTHAHPQIGVTTHDQRPTSANRRPYTSNYNNNNTHHNGSYRHHHQPHPHGHHYYHDNYNGPQQQQEDGSPHDHVGGHGGAGGDDESMELRSITVMPHSDRSPQQPSPPPPPESENEPEISPPICVPSDMVTMKKVPSGPSAASPSASAGPCSSQSCGQGHGCVSHKMLSGYAGAGGLTREDLLFVAHEYLDHLPKTSQSNPGGLGLAAFALTTFMLSVINTRLVDKSVGNVVLPVALWFGGVAQVLAGMWEFHIANTFGATAFTAYGCFWLSFATLEYYIVPTWSAASVYDKNQALGLFLLSWTIFTAYMLMASIKLSRGLLSVFVPLEVAFILLTAGAFAGEEKLTKAGGWFGILTAFLAWYCSAAIIMNWSWKKELLPLGVVRPPAPVKA